MHAHSDMHRGFALSAFHFYSNWEWEKQQPWSYGTALRSLSCCRCYITVVLFPTISIDFAFLSRIWIKQEVSSTSTKVAECVHTQITATSTSSLPRHMVLQEVLLGTLHEVLSGSLREVLREVHREVLQEVQPEMCTLVREVVHEVLPEVSS